jgi:acyl carrier protein
MTRPSVLETVREIASDVFAVSIDRIESGSSPDTIPSWDSLHHINLVLSLEQEFGLQFTPEDMMEMLSIELIVLLVEEKLGIKDE